MEEWRIIEVLKLLRQCVTCPICGALVATQAGIDAHTKWHDGMNQYVAGVDQQLNQFADYITNPVTGLQKQIQDRLDTITEYVIAPETGLEARTTVAITSLRDDATNAINQLRNDATNAITALSTRVTALETTLRGQSK